MIETGEDVVALDDVGVVKVFEDGNLMIEKSLGSFAFEWLVFDEFDGNGLLILFVNAEVDLAETSLSDGVGPLEKIMLDFLDCILGLRILGNHLSVLLVHV